jgi:hypothetical protein
MHLLKTALICAMPLMLAAASRAEDAADLLNTSAPLDTIHTQRTDVPAMGPDGQYTTGQDGGTVPVQDNPLCSANMGPTLSITTALLLWKLENAVNQPLVINPVTLAPRLTTADMGFGYQPGMKTDVKYLSPEEDSAFEIVYYGIYEWTDNREIDAPPTVRLPANFGNFNGVPYSNPPTAAQLEAGTHDWAEANSITFRNQSTFNSVEANLVWGGQKTDSGVLFGPRYLGLYESFRMQAVSTIVNGANAQPSVYDISTRNDLLGAQVGYFYRQKSNCWDNYFYFKGGLYGNNARQSTFVTDDASGVVLRNFSPSASITASSLEAGISAARQINKTWLLRFGYDAIWVQDVARATDQLDFTTNPTAGSTLQFRQGALMHGGNIGVEARY